MSYDGPLNPVISVQLTYWDMNKLCDILHTAIQNAASRMQLDFGFKLTDDCS